MCSSRTGAKKLKILLVIIITIFIITYLSSSKKDSRKDTKSTDLESYTALARSGLYRDYTRAEILKETKRFADLHTRQDDPELIKFVKSLLKPPSKGLYHLQEHRISGDYSQEGQSLYIDELLKGRTDGFYIGMVTFLIQAF